HVHDPVPVRRVVALALDPAERGHGHDTRRLGGQVEAGGVDLTGLDRTAAVIRAAIVDELVLQVDVGVAGRGDVEHTPALRVPQGPLHGLPDRTLPLVVTAVELPRVD